MGLGNVWFTQVSADGSYLVDLLPGFFAIGVGLGFSFVPVSIAALAGVAPQRGRPRVRACSTRRSRSAARSASPSSRPSRPTARAICSTRASRRPQALTSGFTLAFWVAVGFARRWRCSRRC